MTGERARAVIWSLTLSLTLSASGAAQRPADARNAIYVEAFGNALSLGSVNYERWITAAQTLRVGLNPVGSAVLMGNHLVRLGGSHWGEVGAGVLLGAGNDGFATATLGYRLQPAGKSGLFRVTLAPLVSRSGVAMWSGVSLGVVF